MTGTGRSPSRARSSLVCPSCMTNMLYIPGGAAYRCDQCRQTWECIEDDAETAPARTQS